MFDGDVQDDVVLHRGDVIFVPKQFDETTGKNDLSVSKVRIMGMVAHPGWMNLDKNDELVSVICKAGGLTAGADTRHIRIARSVNGHMQTQTFQLTRAAITGGNVIDVRNGDVITVEPLITQFGLMRTPSNPVMDLIKNGTPVGDFPHLLRK
jgi:hypothetical protein